MSDALALIIIVLLVVFVGTEVISKVSFILHTLLMSGANAIHGVILIGVILVAGQAEFIPLLALALVAVVLAAVNMIGGFVVIDWMLSMFSGRWLVAPSKPLELDK